MYPTLCSRIEHIASLFLSVPSHLLPFLDRPYWTNLAAPCSETFVTAPQGLFSGHNRPTFGAFSLKARASQLVRFSFTTFRADAVSTRACSKTASSTATATTSPHASPGSRPLASWPCSLSSRHLHHLLLALHPPSPGSLCVHFQQQSRLRVQFPRLNGTSFPLGYSKKFSTHPLFCGL
jgi:hypothetical protein